VSVPAASQTFSAHAAQYTALRRRLVPRFEPFYGAVIEVLRVTGTPRRVLDLGAGTGLLGAVVREAFPAVRLELLDGSEVMLAEAVERLGDAVDAVHVADMAGPLPSGPFDAVVSALAIHHLEDDAKRDLMVRVRAILRPGGVFVNAEQVAAPAPALEGLYERRWAEECRALGATEAELDGARQRMRQHDRCADVRSQLSWLTEAGFEFADCVYKSWRLAVLAGFTEAPADMTQAP
jgi:tRNA (cmo5U34)-methyltransferase